MKAVRAAGFTLIELLTVIAIIAILAGLTAVALPRVLARAKIADVETDFGAIRTSLAAYATDYGTYPPAYGYRMFLDRPIDNANSPVYKHQDYTLDIGIEGALKLYDRFSENYDTNQDGNLSRLEFIPLPGDDGASSWLLRGLLDTPYPGDQPVTSLQKRVDTQRPYVYVPYYKKNIDRMKRIAGNAWDGASWNGNFIPDDNSGIVPPPTYDGFVLISVGPLNHTRGMLKPPGDETAWLNSTGESMPQNEYFVLGLRAAYLATRDADDNGLLDFEYRTRTRNNEGQNWPTMPDGLQLFAAPIIFTSD